MLNKKLSDLFQIRKQNPKRQEKVSYFDQNYFHCRLISRGFNTQLIRIQTQVKENGQPLDQIRCKWYIKNTQDFKEIEDVTSQYYQPCLDDVGSIICVQIQPFIEGKKYKGITIMKESQIIGIDDKLQAQLQTFLKEGSIKFQARIQTVFSQNPKYQAFEFPLQIKMQILNNQIVFLANNNGNGGQQFQRVQISEQYPSVQFIRKSFNSIIFNYNEKQSMKISLNNNFARDSFALIVRTCAAHTDKINPELKSEKMMPQSYKGQQEVGIRDVEKEPVSNNANIQVQDTSQKIIQETNQSKQPQLSTTKAEDLIDPHQQKYSIDQSESQSAQSSSMNDLSPLLQSKSSSPQIGTTPAKNKAQQPKQSSTTLILRIDELNKQLKQNKRKYEQLSLNYNIQKQNKMQVQEQLLKNRQKLTKLQQQHNESLKICRRIQQLSEDNRFYKNQISIMKKQLKKSKEIIKQLQKKMSNNQKSQANQYENKIQQMKVLNDNLLQQNNQIIRKKQEMELQFEHFKTQIEQLDNQNKQLQQKILSLNSQRRNIGKESEEIHLASFKNNGQKSTASQTQDKVKQLQMKLKNVEMLLKYKASQGQNSSSFQLLVNKLTQTITEKQFQLGEVKKINKNLLQQLKYYKNKA